jgi:hypothetical protein
MQWCWPLEPSREAAGGDAKGMGPVITTAAPAATAGNAQTQCQRLDVLWALEDDVGSRAAAHDRIPFAAQPGGTGGRVGV